jgi:hypothetical protein
MVDHAAMDLAIFIDNTRNLSEIKAAFRVNYSKKKAKGIYNRELALKGIRNNLIPEAAKVYSKEFGGLPTVNFPTESRNRAAEMVLQSIEDEISSES